MLVKINNRLQSLPEGLTFKKVKPGHYTAEFNGNSYSIIGGKAAGGARTWPAALFRRGTGLRSRRDDRGRREADRRGR